MDGTSFERVSIDAPSISVDTSDGYVRELTEFVEVVTEQR